MLRRFAALIAALSLTLVSFGSALAVPITNPLPIGPDDYSSYPPDGDCPTVDEGFMVWHFVLTDSPSQTDTLNLTFTLSGGGVLPISDSTPDKTSPDKEDATHWTLHWYITTPAGATLTDADTVGTEAGNLVLSHICPFVPPPVIPEAPLAVLLVLTGGLTAAWFVSRRMRSSATPTPA